MSKWALTDPVQIERRQRVFNDMACVLAQTQLEPYVNHGRRYTRDEYWDEVAFLNRLSQALYRGPAGLPAWWPELDWSRYGR